jgi:hypothetical protein
LIICRWLLPRQSYDPPDFFPVDIGRSSNFVPVLKTKHGSFVAKTMIFGIAD